MHGPRKEKIVPSDNKGKIMTYELWINYLNVKVFVFQVEAVID